MLVDVFRCRIVNEKFKESLTKMPISRVILWNNNSLSGQ